MVILNLKGGLGNQIFQYVAALVYAKKFDKKLYIYTGNLKSYKTKRKFSLNVFIEDYPFEIVLIESKNILFLKKHFLVLLKKINLFVITEKNFFKKPNFFISVIDDYFINSMFLDDEILKIFIKLLNDNFSYLINDFATKNGIGIHIRGTDRLSENIDIKYDELLTDLSIDKSKILYCFTDDIDYAKKQLINIDNKIIYISDFSLTDLEEFYLISKMDEFIVSNSTFSILARRLSSAETKTYVVKDLFDTRDSALLNVFNFDSSIIYL